jgi:hypothetical protein
MKDYLQKSWFLLRVQGVKPGFQGPSEMNEYNVLYKGVLQRLGSWKGWRLKLY